MEIIIIALLAGIILGIYMPRPGEMSE